MPPNPNPRLTVGFVDREAAGGGPGATAEDIVKRVRRVEHYSDAATIRKGVQEMAGWGHLQNPG